MKEPKDYNTVLIEAKAAAVIAFNACVLVPVSWVSTDLFNKPLSKPSEPDLEGDCGGAYITGIPGNSHFIKWCKVNQPRLIAKGVYKGYDMLLLIDGYNGQSAEKREAYCRAFAKVLQSYGVVCSTMTYLT
jgi:hypothetical protein